MTSKRITGIVKFYNDSKGYGFIKTLSHDSIFVHWSAIDEKFPTLVEDQEVTLEVVKGNFGLQAINVKKKE